MKRNIRQVRKQIKKRKQYREQSMKMNPNSWEKRNALHLSDAERHGDGMPSLPDITNFRWRRKSKNISSPLLKIFLSILLFGLSAFTLENNRTTFTTSQEWLRSNLTEEFPFAKVNQWYVQTLGSPLAISPQGKMPEVTDVSAEVLPVLGQVVETFSSNGEGIKISPDKRTMVHALAQGIVIFTGTLDETKKTIIIQHADGSNSTYGFLSTIDVHLYQAVSPNQMIGSFTPSSKYESVYFSIEKDQQFIDPSQVVPVYDVP